MRRSYIWVFLCLVLCACATMPAGKEVKIENYPNKPDLVVYEYCTADAYGARLSTGTVQSISRYCAASNSLEVKTDKILVIDEFKLEKTQVIEDYATVQVKYKYLVILKPLAQDSLNDKVQGLPNYVNFILSRENGLWKITSAPPEPCVYKETALSFIDNLSNTLNDEQKVKVQYLGYELKDIN
jgi:hypothetical protein